jgi:tRNA-specific 2-thiouridylase
MLGTVDPALLEHVAFPLGGQTKAETRAEAEAAGMAAAGRAESQEACFLAGADYRTFLERQGVASAPGPIVDETGAVLGAHRGLWRYTPGQRRGIGLAAREPLHVLRADGARNALVVGPRRALGSTRVEAVGRLYVESGRVEAKLRYRSDPVGALVEQTGDGFTLLLEEPVEAVAPGQVAVLYDDDAVVGAGVISGAGL